MSSYARSRNYVPKEVWDKILDMMPSEDFKLPKYITFFNREGRPTTVKTKYISYVERYSRDLILIYMTGHKRSESISNTIENDKSFKMFEEFIRFYLPDNKYKYTSKRGHTS